jgi:hypothetical protein
VLDALDLEPEGWQVQRLDMPARAFPAPDGGTVELADSVLAVRRASA